MLFTPSSFSIKKTILVIFTLVVLTSGIFIGARFVNFAQSLTLNKQSFFKDLTAAITGSDALDDSNLADAIKNQRSINVLLLGYGGGSHSGTLLTDTMLIAHFDFKTNKIAMISVPRDLWVKIPTRGYEGTHLKINAAYEIGADENNYPNKLPQFTGARGGGNESKYLASEVTGLPIDYFASVDFEGFKKIVDALGGVSIDVENSFTDYTYPSGDSKADGPICSASDSVNSECRYLKLHFDKGLQYMDGDRALQYVRSRHAAGIEGSDFARSKRQQKLIAAIEEKSLQWGSVTKIFSLMSAIEGHFETDLSLVEIKDLSSYAQGLDFNGAEKISLTDQNLLVNSTSEDGQAILLPTAGIDDYSDIHKFIKAQLDPEYSDVYDYLNNNSTK